MTDTARILCTTEVVCTAKQPAGQGISRLGFSSGTPYGDPGAAIGPSGLSMVMPDAAAQLVDVGTHLTLVFTDGAVG